MAIIKIDGKSYEVDSSKNLLEVVLSLGFDLPYFCWHPALGSVGSCRQCAVKKYRGEEDTQGQIVMACMEPTLDGLNLSIEDQEASDFREKVIEWLMLNHPHDCPVCDEGGECHLQDMTVMAGHSYRRSKYKKRTHKNQDLGPCINHEMNRCIQCYRCVRFYNDFAGGDDLQVFSAHDHVYFGRHEDGTLESEFSGNLVEVCPTGVFTDKTLKDHYTRKWDLTSAPSVCHHCSLGCNTMAGERYGSLRRVLSRFNPEVNGYFLCDRGRFGYDFVNGESRIRYSVATNDQDNALDSQTAVEQLQSVLGNGPVLGIGSPRASLESNYLLRTLVGEDHFYNGVGARENEMLQLALQFLQEGPVTTPSLNEIESCDVVIVIGEDLTNTAPMLDLALNQSVRVRPLEQIEKIGIPDWNDAAAREYLQNEKGPLYMLTPQATKLDRIATKCFRAGINELTDLVTAMAHQLDDGVPVNQQLTNNNEIVQEITNALSGAKRPLIITGSSLGSVDLMKATINLANALHGSNNQTGISFVFPECNSLGVGMMESKSLSDAFSSSDQYKAVVILENDLFRRGPAAGVEQFISSFSKVVVLDHTESDTSSKANLLLAAGTYAEADGTLVNNEGRAQRFFQVQASDTSIQESWRWLIQAGKMVNNETIKTLSVLDDVISSIEQAMPQFQGISKAALSAGHRIHGQKISRAPHRYSGRTSMFADNKVSEARPPQDADSPLSFTMEGYRGIPPASTTSFYWSPGWNSAQSINKFRNEVAHGRQDVEVGIRLIEPAEESRFQYHAHGTSDAIHSGQWTIVPTHSIFGSEEMSIKSQAISERGPAPAIVINLAQAKEMNIQQGDEVAISSDLGMVTLPAQLAPDWPKDHLGVPAGFPGIAFMDNSSSIQLKNSQG